MAEKKKPSTTSSNATSSTGWNSTAPPSQQKPRKQGANQKTMRGVRTTTTTRRGNETQSDSEFVSTVQTNDSRQTSTTTTGTSLISIATTESQLPPPIQEALTTDGTSTGAPNRYGTSTSVVTSRQYEPEPGTTVTHTTITFTDPQSSNIPVGSAGSTPVSVDPPQETTPKQAPKMVVPNMSAPVQSPVFLRVNPLQSAIVAHISGEHLSTPIQEVELWRCDAGTDQKQTARHRMAPSAETCVCSTFAMPAYVAKLATIQYIINTPERKVTAFCLPPKQKVQKRKITRKLACAHLMLPPQGPLEAEKLRPLWDTITFTIAFGKHVGIEYRIPKLTTIKTELVKWPELRHVAKEVDSKVLYKKVEPKNVIRWLAEKPHQIILSTVEKCDPIMVRRVKLEQNPLYERMPAYCNVAEVDLYTTEEIESKAPASGGGPEKTCTERHRYHEHQLIQRWKNTIHVENRRRQLSE